MNEDQDFPTPEQLVHMAQEERIARVANLILSQAAKDRASAIHVETQDQSLQVRFRVDGQLVVVMTPPLEIGHALVARFKHLGGLDLFERRVPLRGRFPFRHSEQDFEMQVSTLPCANGEKVTIYVQLCEDLRSLDQLALSEGNLSQLKAMLGQGSGLVLVSGPGGAGKTTTLYSCLAQVASEAESIVTLEERVRYRQADYSQVVLNSKVGLTLATALQAALESDPDVLMIGFLRGPGAVELALDAACRGHLVLAGTYHESTAHALHSLLHLGLETALVADAYRGGIAQRLARTNCPDCKTVIPDHPYFRGEGCDNCRGRGTLGLMAIQEVLINSPSLRQLLLSGATLEQLRPEVSMAEDALAKARSGHLSPGEVVRLFKGKA